MALTTDGAFMPETSAAGRTINKAMTSLLNASDAAMAETVLPTALNDALDAMSQIIPIVEPGDNSRIANLARALHSIKVDTMPGVVEF